MLKITIILFLLLSSLYSKDEFLKTLEKRVYSEIIYEKISKINILNSYITRYILSHGRISPTKLDLTTLYPELLLWWPSGIDNTKDIEFEIDNNLFRITYSNLFKNPSKDYINRLLKTSRALRLNSFVNNDNEIVIAYSKKLNILINSLNNITSLQNNISKESSIEAKCDINTTTYAGKTVYILDGSKSFDLKYCPNDHIKFERLNLNVYKYFDIYTKWASYISQEVINKVNSSEVNNYIYNGTTFLRIKK